MRILFVTQWFDPEPIAKGMCFASELVARGHVVEVLTGFPNYPAGRLYPGYRLRVFQRETVSGVTVNRVPLYPSHDRSRIRRSANYGTFATSALLLGPALVHRPDVIYAYHPPATVAVPALALKRIFHAPVVYDIQDMWPDTIRATGMLSQAWVLRAIDAWCRTVYRGVDRIVVLSPGFKAMLTERGVPDAKVDVIYNWTSEVQGDDPKKAVPESMGFAGRFNVVFAGTMGAAQALEAVLSAADLLKARLPTVRFVFVGDGTERLRLEALAKGMGLDNVVFFPWQPAAAMAPILSAADALLVHLKDDPLFRITIPSKTQAYLAAARPMIMAVAGDAGHLVERSGAGLVCRPEDPSALVDAVQQLASMADVDRERMGRLGRTFYDAELSLARGVSRFEEIFTSVSR